MLKKYIDIMNEKKHPAAFKKGRIPWNKGLTKDSDERIRNSIPKLVNSMKGISHPQSEITKGKIRQVAIKRELGGHTSKIRINYICKNGTVIHLQSSYEIEVAKTLDENNIIWNRPKHIIWNDNEKIRRYYPDFYLVDYNIYLDPKNDFLIKKDQRKIEEVSKQNNIIVLILNKKELNWITIKNKILSVSI